MLSKKKNPVVPVKRLGKGHELKNENDYFLLLIIFSCPPVL